MKLSKLLEPFQALRNKYLGQSCICHRPKFYGRMLLRGLVFALLAYQFGEEKSCPHIGDSAYFKGNGFIVFSPFARVYFAIECPERKILYITTFSRMGIVGMCLL